MRARIGVISLLLLGCSADTQDTSKLEDQLSRIEARLERMDERLQSYEHTEVVANTVPIDLPVADASPALHRIAVSISPTQLSINGETVANVALRARLEELAAKSSDASVVIQADRSVDHGHVVFVMDTIKKAGFSRIAIAVAASEPHEG